jgi:osmotically-inducible protein OsmY
MASRGMFGYEGEGFMRGTGSWPEHARSDFGGYYARDTHYEGLGDDYARERPVGYRGRGPKNWRRPDDRIADEIHQRLTDDDWVDATEIDVRVEQGEATLSGTVHTRAEKRRAEDVVERCAGVRDVHNRLRIEATIGKASE